jgi:hypothetical protein
MMKAQYARIDVVQASSIQTRFRFRRTAPSELTESFIRLPSPPTGGSISLALVKLKSRREDFGPEERLVWQMSDLSERRAGMSEETRPVEEPDVEAHGYAPNTGAPNTGAPNTGAPNVGMNPDEEPDVEAHGYAPNTGAPNTGAPNTGAPNVGMNPDEEPDVEAHLLTGAPNTGAPNTGAPNTGAPNTG